MNKLYHLAVGFSGPAVQYSKIQDALSSEAGWARYAPNCWIVSSSETPEEIADRIRAVVSEKDSIFVVAISSSENSGYLQKEIWEWLKEQK